MEPLMNKSLHNIVYRYIKYDNELRPHQGIANAHPSADAPQKEGKIKRCPILFGLYRHYYRDAS